MLTATRDCNIPGYTGHRPEVQEFESYNQRGDGRGHIPGYQGYVPAVKSENLFGSTFGKTS